MQHEVLPRVSLDVSYFRRWYGNFFVIDNRAVSPADVTAFSVTAPNTDSRLPSAGDTITGFYDLNPNRVGQVDNYVTRASNYGDQSEMWSGVDINLSARMRGGLLLQGGSSTGRTTTDSCAIREKLPETAMLNPFCDASTPWLTQIKFVASYSVPRIDVRFSGTLQNLPGPALSATYVASNALVAPSLGRPLSGGAANATVNLIAPGSVQLRSLYAGRSAGRQVDPARNLPGVREPRHVQRAERQLGAVAEQRVRRGDTVADAPVDHAGTAAQDQRAVRLLGRMRSRCLAVVLLAASVAPAAGQVSLVGDWSSRVHEDSTRNDPRIGEFGGHPVHAAGAGPR